MQDGLIRWKRSIVLLVALLLIAVFNPFRFGYFSVCSVCGAVRNSTCREVPIVSIEYWCSHSVEQSALSKSAAEAGLVGLHEHQWLFGHGGGGGIVCALGPGMSIRPASDSEVVAAFIAAMSIYEGQAAAKEWLRRALTPESGGEIRDVLQFTGFPANGFRSKQEYEDWRGKADGELKQLLGAPEQGL
jgi:hypothetical protein